MKGKRTKRLQSAEELRAAVAEWSAIIKARPKQIRIQQMSRKWASCSSKGCVTFSSELFDQPYPFQEFVIVHELLHLRIPNHGKLFKSLLQAYLPQFKWVEKIGSSANPEPSSVRRPRANP